MIDVIVPNYNGRHHLEICIPALLRQTRRADVRILVVDDCSTDDSVAFLATTFPTVAVLTLPYNQGFVAACNAAIAATDGEYVVLLNNDTECDEHWLGELVGALEADPAYAFAASKLMLFDRRDIIHSAGDFYRIDGIPGNRGVWQADSARYNQREEVWGPCAGAAAYRRSALAQLAVNGHVFDPDLGMYCEDVDLNLRARLHGMRTIYVPTAMVYHRLSATGGGTLASYYCGRNFVLVWLKNMPAQLFWGALPAMIWQQLLIFGSALWHIRGAAARARLRGQLAVFAKLRLFLTKRRAIPADVDIAALHLTT
ncbi:MAG: glycosyltransferase family 2 protein [Chloroflexi bacterium]|nr:MAG: glycosyltransferase family 2 protein [Chloroflexota bacterium]RLT33913.1 MAG: glycosyltransferase family 2 protein [Chloroflexota bacterium]